jgi:hypothetical protein
MVGGLEDFFSPTRLGYVGMIIQSDELIFFQRGGLNHQPDIAMPKQIEQLDGKI